MYIHWDIEEETIKNIITALSSEMSLERYRKEEALERLKEAKDKANTNDSLRKTINQLNEEKRELESKLEGSHAVIDDLLKEGQEKDEKIKMMTDKSGSGIVISDLMDQNADKDAQIKALTDENTALQETIRGMSERIEKLIQSLEPDCESDASRNYEQIHTITVSGQDWSKTLKAAYKDASGAHSDVQG